MPYIEDPNTGVSMFESADILNYLQDTYASPLGSNMGTDLWKQPVAAIRSTKGTFGV